MSSDPPRVSWIDAEAARVRHEQAEMDKWAPDMQWRTDLAWPLGRVGAGWEGHAPAWGGDRSEPAGVANLLTGRRLRLRVMCPEAFPMVAPDLYPLDPEVPIVRRTQHKWHVNGDGSLCLMQVADDWQPENTAADLVRKAAGWFIEYLLVEGGDLDRMTERGIYASDELDALLAAKFA
jgi:hypothetical protein